jgi:hypothetical protein
MCGKELNRKRKNSVKYNLKRSDPVLSVHEATVREYLVAVN